MTLRLILFRKASPTQPALFQAPVNTLTPDHGGRLKPVKQTIKRKDGTVFQQTRWVLPAAAPSAPQPAQPQAPQGARHRKPATQPSIEEATRALRDLDYLATTALMGTPTTTLPGFMATYHPPRTIAGGATDPGFTVLVLADETPEVGPIIVLADDDQEPGRTLLTEWAKSAPAGAQPITREQADSAARTFMLTARAKHVLSWRQRNETAQVLDPRGPDALSLLVKLEAWAASKFTPDDLKDPVGGKRRLTRCAPDVETHVQARLDATHDHSEHGAFRTRLVAAYDITYDHPGFDEAAKRLGNVKSLYTGVARGRALSAIGTGLKTPKEVGSVTGAMFGDGIYMADNSSKSAQYVGEHFDRDDTEGIMLEVDAVMGKMHEAASGMYSGLDDLPQVIQNTVREFVRAAWDAVKYEQYSAARWFSVPHQYLTPAILGHIAETYSSQDERFVVEDRVQRVLDKVKTMVGGLPMDAWPPTLRQACGQLQAAVDSLAAVRPAIDAATRQILSAPLTAEEMKTPTVDGQEHLAHLLATQLVHNTGHIIGAPIRIMSNLRDDLYDTADKAMNQLLRKHPDLTTAPVEQVKKHLIRFYDSVERAMTKRWKGPDASLLTPLFEERRTDASLDKAIRAIQIRHGYAASSLTHRLEAVHEAIDAVAHDAIAGYRDIIQGPIKDYFIGDGAYQQYYGIEMSSRFGADLSEVHKGMNESVAAYTSIKGLSHREGGGLRNNEFVVYDSAHVKMRRALLVKRERVHD